MAALVSPVNVVILVETVKWKTDVGGHPQVTKLCTDMTSFVSFQISNIDVARVLY